MFSRLNKASHDLNVSVQAIAKLAIEEWLDLIMKPSHLFFRFKFGRPRNSLPVTTITNMDVPSVINNHPQIGT